MDKRGHDFELKFMTVSRWQTETFIARTIMFPRNERRIWLFLTDWDRSFLFAKFAKLSKVVCDGLLYSDSHFIVCGKATAGKLRTGLINKTHKKKLRARRARDHQYYEVKILNRGNRKAFL